MPAIVALQLDGSLAPSGVGSRDLPPAHLMFVVDEGAVLGPIEVADGATAVPLPGIGAGAADITTVQYFYLTTTGALTLNYAGAAIPMIGTVATPAVFLVALTSNTAVPTVTNASGASVSIFYSFGGT